MIAKLTNVIDTSNVSIDSFDLKLPVRKINIINQNLVSCWERVNTGTGDIAKNGTSCPSDVYEGEGYNIIFKTEKQRCTGNYVVFEPYLVVQLTSKVLHGDYLNGITKDNVNTIYEWLLRTNFIELDKSVFYDSEIINIDWKIDFNLSIKWHDFLSGLIKIVRPSKFSDLGYRKFSNDLGKEFTNGIYLGNKKGFSVSRPFVRMYDKFLQLKQVNREFMDAHLSNTKITNLYRIEMNIKNRNHLKKLGIEDNRLNSILHMDNNKQKEIFKKGVTNHFDVSLIKKRKSTMNIRDKFDAYIFDMMISGNVENYMKEHFDLTVILNNFCSEFEVSSSTKSKLKDRLLGIVSRVQSGDW